MMRAMGTAPTERFMWGQDVGEELSPQWSDADVEAMRRIAAGLGPRPFINRLPAWRIVLEPSPVITRRQVPIRDHVLMVKVRPSVPLKKDEAAALLAHLLGSLDLDAKPYAVPGTCVEAYADRLEVKR